MYDEITQAIINMAMLTKPYAQIVLGSMPPDNGIALTAYGGPDSLMLDIGAEQRLNIVLNGKNSDQLTVVQALNAIHRELTFRKDFPSGLGWQIYSIQTVASPRLLGREQNNQWLYGSSLVAYFYQEGLSQ